MPASIPRTRALLIGALLAVLAPLPAQAGPGQDRLTAFYEGTDTIEARFKQVVTGPDGNVQEESAGRVWIHRPDRFRWSYRKPYEQEIIGNGETVQLYDPDMKQVTVRPYSSAMGATPSLVLAGGGRLKRHFRVEEQGKSEDLAWVALVPRNPEETGFKRARVGLAADPARVVRFEFTDAFGNRSVMTFSNIQLDGDIPRKRFQFDPPAGTDIVGPAAGEPNQP